LPLGKPFPFLVTNIYTTTTTTTTTTTLLSLFHPQPHTLLLLYLQCLLLVTTYPSSAAKHFQSIYGIEVSELAVNAAIANAELNQLSPNTIEFKCGLSEEIFSSVSSLPAQETVIIIDPPRKGCDEQFLKQLFLFRPKKLVYVSCDPATQARDVKAIVAEGYVVVDVTPFDLFPQTRHIENVMTLVLA